MQPSTSVMPPATIATTGPNTIAPKALMKNAVLMRSSSPTGMLSGLSATRRAIISAANTSTFVLRNSPAACFQ